MLAIEKQEDEKHQMYVEQEMRNTYLPFQILMRIMKLAKYRLKAQVEKDEGPSGEGQSPRVEKDEGPSGEG